MSTKYVYITSTKKNFVDKFYRIMKKNNLYSTKCLQRKKFVDTNVDTLNPY